MSRRKRSSAVADKFAQEEKNIAAKRKQAYMPFRFWLKKEEEVEIVILDEWLDDGHSMYEHNVQIDGKWGNFLPCIKETHECPNCKEYPDNPSYLVLMLSVLVLKEWTNKKTGEVHPYTRMLLPIKRASHADFARLENISEKKGKSLRGAVILMHRDSGDGANIGAPIPNEDGSVLDEWLTEEQLVEEFGHDAVVDREGKIVKEANADLQPLDYLKLFPDMSEELGNPNNTPMAGSKEEEEAELEDDVPNNYEEKPSRSRRSRRSRSVEAEEVEEEPIEAEEAAEPIEEEVIEAEEAPKRRSRRRGKSEPF